MRQERTRINSVTRPGGPAVVWRCPTCQGEFFSRYAGKQHRQFAACETVSEKPKSGGVVATAA